MSLFDLMELNWEEATPELLKALAALQVELIIFLSGTDYMAAQVTWEDLRTENRPRVLVKKVPE